MFNIRANIGDPRFNLSSLAKDMGLGGQRQRDKEVAAENGAARNRAKRILDELSTESKEEQALPAPSTNGHAETPANGRATATNDGRVDELSEARRLAAEQRKAAESLLNEARALEQQLLSETAAVHEARQKSDELAAAASRAVVAEQEARERTRLAAERHTLVTAERGQIEAVMTASQRAMEAATAEIAELKKRLEDVLKIATDASELLHAQEQRAAESETALDAAEKELADANAELAQRQTEREAAEKAAKAAEERASSFGKAVLKTVQGTPAAAKVRESNDAA
jgi:chromosome segregation ATPase